MITGIMIGAWMSGRLAGRLSPLRTIRLGYALMFAGVAHQPRDLLVRRRPACRWNVMPIMVFTIGSSLVMPSVTLLLLDLFPAMPRHGVVAAGFRPVRAVRGRRRHDRTVPRRIR